MNKLIAVLMGVITLSMLQARRSTRNGGGYAAFGMGLSIGAPIGGVYYADGPQGSNPYYGTPVNYGGFYAPYGYAAYAGPVVYWGW